MCKSAYSFGCKIRKPVACRYLAVQTRGIENAVPYVHSVPHTVYYTHTHTAVPIPAGRRPD